MGHAALNMFAAPSDRPRSLKLKQIVARGERSRQLDFTCQIRQGRPMASFMARILHYVHLVRRSHTLGVRAIVQKPNGAVLLVKHTYVNGWYLPGGGVEWGETFHQAVEKELREEAGVTLTSPAKLLALYHNKSASKRDQVALYHCPNWQQLKKPNLPNQEILAADFFPLDALPKGTTNATKRRLAEFAANGPYDEYW